MTAQHVQTLIIGAGQAGLTTGYHLKRRGLPFLVVDANERIGDNWRRQWDTLTLYTPAKYDSLPGLRFPADPWHYPGKDEVADYLESYAEHFELPIRHGVRVDHLTHDGNRFLATSGDMSFEAGNVIVAMASYQVPKRPGFANELDSQIVQLHVDDPLGEADAVVVAEADRPVHDALDLLVIIRAGVELQGA